MQYESTIGLEVHVQVNTASKMFCSCPNKFGAEPNTLVCPVCLGYPGVLPTLNREMVNRSLAAGLMCRCRIASYSKFDRKNYFYPDMPKNYQISQYDMPLCTDGKLHIAGTGFSGEELEEKDIRVRRIHMEEDVAKSTHKTVYSVVDFNRAGIPLLEIVSEPDMSTPDEAYAYLTALKQIMQYTRISDCDMEKGQMRCDVNVSIRSATDREYGTKVEIKNLNSFRAVHRALTFEIERQQDALEEGSAVTQETRRWDDENGVTVLMRTKEQAHDYRYFPEPDLMPMHISSQWLEQIAETLPERPDLRRTRLVKEYGVRLYDAQVLTQEKALADYYEQAAADSPDPQTVANLIITDLLGALSQTGRTIQDSPVPPEHIAELVKLINAGTISTRIARDIFGEMLENGTSPDRIVKEKGLEQVSDEDTLDSLVDQVLSENNDAVQQYNAGKTNALKFLMGQVMKLSKGKANPQKVNQKLKEKMEQGG